MGISRATSPGKTSTISEFISFKNSDELSYNNLSFRDTYDSIIYPIKNIIDDYIDELMELTVSVTLNDVEYLKYKYKPKILAKDIYNNAELDFIILRINGICNMKEFDMRTMRLIKSDDLTDFLTSIYNANKTDIDIYNADQSATTL